MRVRRLCYVKHGFINNGSSLRSRKKLHMSMYRPDKVRPERVGLSSDCPQTPGFPRPLAFPPGFHTEAEGGWSIFRGRAAGSVLLNVKLNAPWEGMRG